jgi:uncharacterized RDD family membrane protein YckC
VNASRPVVENDRAGLVSRATGDLLDAFVVVLGAEAIVIVGTTLRTLFVGSTFALPHLRAAATLGGLSFVFVAYLTFFWASTGRTPGKQAAGLRVVTSRGDRLGVLRAAARAALCVAFPLGLLWVLVSPRNRAFHDAVVGTAVVYDWHTRGGSARSPASPTW